MFRPSSPTTSVNGLFARTLSTAIIMPNSHCSFNTLISGHLLFSCFLYLSWRKLSWVEEKKKKSALSSKTQSWSCQRPSWLSVTFSNKLSYNTVFLEFQLCVLKPLSDPISRIIPKTTSCYILKQEKSLHWFFSSVVLFFPPIFSHFVAWVDVWNVRNF